MNERLQAGIVVELKERLARAEVARIDEAACIGCTRCIQACPYDAILGAANAMHTVLAQVCTGCALCVPPCPVDCIRLLPTGERLTEEQQRAAAQQARARYENRIDRLTKETEALAAQRKMPASAAGVDRATIARVIAKARARLNKGST